ncbi:DUF29 family protein [Nostoc sp.]
MSQSSLYEQDFLAWLTQQQSALANRDVAALDWENRLKTLLFR